MELTYETIEANTTSSNFERGRLIYHRGQVKFFKIINDLFVIAKVKGTKTYKVYLEYIDDTYKAYCSCLYLPKGQCKHQVAVKFTLMEFLKDKNRKPENKTNTKLFSKPLTFLLKEFYKLKYKYF